MNKRSKSVAYKIQSVRGFGRIRSRVPAHELGHAVGLGNLGDEQLEDDLKTSSVAQAKGYAAYDWPGAP